jgi:hypothetical protein
MQALVPEADSVDRELLDRVARLLTKKALALEQLREMNAEARQRRASGEQHPFDDVFQNKYAAKVIEVRFSDLCERLDTCP